VSSLHQSSLRHVIGLYDHVVTSTAHYKMNRFKSVHLINPFKHITAIPLRDTPLDIKEFQRTDVRIWCPFWKRRSCCKSHIESNISGGDDTS
jgi:hypothetical protein